jgi:hypothetical protein
MSTSTNRVFLSLDCGCSTGIVLLFSSPRRHTRAPGRAGAMSGEIVWLMMMLLMVLLFAWPGGSV